MNYSTYKKIIKYCQVIIQVNFELKQVAFNNKLSGLVQISMSQQLINRDDIILMLNYNRPMRQSLQRSKRIQKNTHTASIILKPQDSYTDALYLPLREAVNKRLDTQNLSQTHANSQININSSMNMQNKNNKKILDRSVRLDKSPTLKIEKQNKYDMGVGHSKPQYKLKMSNQIHGRIETDRKQLRRSMDKAMKTIRLKTDYNQILQARQKESSISISANTNKNQAQVSTKNTQEHTNSSTNKVIFIQKSQLIKIHKKYKKLLEENVALKRQMSFVGRCGRGSGGGGGGNNCGVSTVLKALNL